MTQYKCSFEPNGEAVEVEAESVEEALRLYAVMIAMIPGEHDIVYVQYGGLITRCQITAPEDLYHGMEFPNCSHCGQEMTFDFSTRPSVLFCENFNCPEFEKTTGE